MLNQVSTSHNWARQISDMKEAHGLPFAELSYLLGVLALETTTGVLEFFIEVNVL